MAREWRGIFAIPAYAGELGYARAGICQKKKALSAASADVFKKASNWHVGMAYRTSHEDFEKSFAQVHQADEAETSAKRALINFVCIRHVCIVWRSPHSRALW